MKHLTFKHVCLLILFIFSCNLLCYFTLGECERKQASNILHRLILF